MSVIGRKKYTILFVCSIIFLCNISFTAYADGLAVEKLNLGVIIHMEQDPFAIHIENDSHFAASLTIKNRFFALFDFTVGFQNVFTALPPNSHSGSITWNTAYVSFLFDSSILQQKIGMFAGYYDPLGTDIFSQNFFELEPFTSELKTDIFGNNTAIIRPHGIGIHYSLVFPVFLPFAGDISFYWNTQPHAFSTETYAFSQDIRLAAQFNSTILESFIGFTQRIENSLTVATHFGITLSTGKKDTAHLYVQAGITEYIFSKDFDVEALYAFFEPRLIFSPFELAVTAFKFPTKGDSVPVMDELLFVSNPIGFDISPSFSFPHFYNIKTGAHITVSVSSYSEGFAFQITPFMRMQWENGLLHFALSIFPLKPADILKTMRLYAGYKVTL